MIKGDRVSFGWFEESVDKLAPQNLPSERYKVEQSRLIASGQRSCRFYTKDKPSDDDAFSKVWECIGIRKPLEVFLDKSADVLPCTPNFAS
ncbi:hypothetical protein HPP92_028702 [Vanilla planifolia]|uniref:Uncharacterized protein n=1 Tax=Vanilla planifolia TaxID=51239 RepID=A0A835PA23_VANPL|nr:hypothetical protein HPP92_028702 [Vanilla planifolia]KAG0446727.1 hypothetical protein HPP92_028687 [Vanilla planifolia]